MQTRPALKNALDAADAIQADIRARHAAGQTPDEIAFGMGFTRRSVVAVTFGKNPFDHAAHQTGRYHVVDASGFIRSKHSFGYLAYDQAGILSDRESNILFRVIDTRDGSVYGSYLNGEGE